MLRVLVTDDDRDLTETTRVLLECWGHQVFTAHDGTAALRALDGFHPDVVLLDLGLPGTDGYDVARQIRREAGRQPVIVCLSGYGSDEDRRRSREAGCDHHLLKPADPDELRRLLGEIRALPHPAM
jgi:DNA-binding response OmpR family regulator